jgi:hypothetical protein
MSYRKYGLGNSVVRGFGYAAGFAIFSLVVGVVSGATAGLWAATERLGPVARWIVRGLLIFVLVAGLLLILADL